MRSSHDGDLKMRAGSHVNEKPNLRQHGRERLRTESKLLMHTGVHCEHVACAYQYCRSTQGNHLVHESTDEGFMEGCLTSRQLLDSDRDSVVLHRCEIREQESGEMNKVAFLPAGVCPGEWPTKQENEYYEVSKRECDWKLQVEPFVELHRIM